MGNPETPAGGGDRNILDTPRAGPAAIRGGGLRIAGYLVGVLLSVGSAALLFRHLGVTDGGRYVTVLSLVALFGGLTDAGLAGIAVRELVRTEGTKRREFVRSLLGLRIVLSVLAVAGATAFAAAVGYPSAMVAGTALVGLGLLLSGVQVALGTSLMASLRFGWVTLLDLWRQVVLVALIVVLVLAGAGLLPFFAVPVAASLAALVPTALLVRGDIPLSASFRVPAWMGLLREVLPYALATAVTAVYFRVAIILVSLINSSEQTGYFGASFRIVEVVIGIPQLAIGAAFPIFARTADRDPERFAYGVQRVLDVSILLGGLVMVGLLVGAPAAIDIVAGPDFGPAASVLRIQSIGLFASFVAAVWMYVLLSLARYRAILMLNLVTLLINVVLTVVLASVAEARGAAVATVVGEATLAVAAGFVVYRSGLIPISLRVLPRVALAAAPPAALALVSDGPAFLLALVAAVAYIVLVWVLGAVPPELRDEFRGLGARLTRAWGAPKSG
jgi:O-antigen/teichoic acid export membrane protein